MKTPALRQGLDTSSGIFLEPIAQPSARHVKASAAEIGIEGRGRVAGREVQCSFRDRSAFV